MENDLQKQVAFSGIQPSGIPHLGNYIGAMRNWIAMQDQFQCYFSVVDLHAITVRQNPAGLRQQTLDLLATLLAIGLDPKRCTLFIQSHVPQHSQLAWLLNCYTYIGELNRMTQYKEKSARHADNLNAGLYVYPVLMAADILLYQADQVPVGGDQKQHLELTRDIAIRFNNEYGETFRVPEAYIPPFGARIMSLQNVADKMSKSVPEGYISLMDEPDIIVRKLKRAVTDSIAEIRFDQQEQPGIANLLTIFAAIRNENIQQAVEAFSGKGYGELKKQVAETVIEGLRPIRERFGQIRQDKEYLQNVMLDGAQRAERVAVKTLKKAYKKVGFII